MPTADSVKANLQSIISKANGTTGRTDSNVNSAVDALIFGFGQGGGITPTGTVTIRENGTHDVTNYAKALVDVLIPEQNISVIPITLSSALGGGANSNYTLLSGDAFVKAHYTHDGFCCIWIPISNATTAAAANVVGGGFHCNLPVITTKSTYYGGFLRSNGTSSGPVIQVCTAKVNGTGYNISFRADSSGNLKLYVASSYTMPAGEYALIMVCAS